MSIRPEIKEEYIKHLSAIFSDFNYDYKVTTILNYGFGVDYKKDDYIHVNGEESMIKAFEDTHLIKALKTFKGTVLYKIQHYQIKSLIKSFFEKVEAGNAVDYMVKFEDSSINFTMIVDFNPTKDTYTLILKKDSITINYMIDNNGNLFFTYMLTNRSNKDIKISISNIFNGKEYEIPNVYIHNRSKITIREITILKEEIDNVANHYRSGDLLNFNKIMLTALDKSVDEVYNYQTENVVPTVSKLIPDLSICPTIEGVDSKLFIDEIFKAIKTYHYSINKNILEPDMEFPNIVVIGDKLVYMDFKFDDTNWDRYNITVKFISSKDMPGKDIYHLFNNVYIPLIKCDNKYKIDYYDHELILNGFITWMELAFKGDISVSKLYTFMTDYEVRDEAYKDWKNDIEKDKAEPISIMLGIKKDETNNDDVEY